MSYSSVTSFDDVLKVPKAGTLPTITLLVQASPRSQSKWGLGRRCQCPCGRSGSGFPHIEEIFHDRLYFFYFFAMVIDSLTWTSLEFSEIQGRK
jgi:hypothetical protein